MPLALLAAALAAQVATEPQVRIGPQVPPRPTLQLPTLPAPDRPAKPAEPERPRIPIDLGPDAPTTAEPPQQIDILVPPQQSEAADAVELKECAEDTERAVVSGEIVVCRQLPADTSQLYSGSREAWLKAYAERTMNAGTLPPPDVAGPGIFRGPATISGLCFIPPCPKDAPLIIDVTAIPPPPEGSDAERVAKGLAPVEGDDAPLDEEARRRVEAELGLPETPKAEPGG
ncbi:hypothetical protein [Porphyrobacter sp. AAP82]|uniref:hypothetical protein n=1 Tax=Porphyrobacter sp. AAP82 TaxID=1248917 RepID=UPI0002F2684C|nr:hypothetical protein [Porphyrobacter sp. AAP82]